METYAVYSCWRYRWRNPHAEHDFQTPLLGRGRSQEKRGRAEKQAGCEAYVF